MFKTKPILKPYLRFAILFLLFPFFILSQETLSKKELSAVYHRAISDFIIAANKKNKSSFDTIYFGNRKNAQPDDFPDITILPRIENTQILVISPEEGAVKQNKNKKSIYINLMGWVNKTDAEFLFVVFSEGFKHQYDYSFIYRYSDSNKRFELKKIEFKGPPF